MDGRRNQDHHFSGNYSEEQDRDRNRNNVSGYNFHNGYSSLSSAHDDHHGGSDHVHLHESSSNNGGLFVLHDSRHNHQFPANGIILDPQAGGGPIGLRVRKSPSLMKELNFHLNKEKQVERNQEQIVKKLKATNIPAVFLKIGSMEWKSKNQGDLVAKFYYGRKKLVWEFLYGHLKKKIEICWDQISAINTFVGEDKKGVLKIELKKKPKISQEVNFERGKHTSWGTSEDFTKDQATICRWHTVEFLPGDLHESLEKLLQCDARLFDLSRKPFPYDSSPFFDNQILDFSNNRTVVHGTVVGQHEKFLPPVQNLDQPATSSFVRHSNSNLHMPDLEVSDPDELPLKKQRTDDILEQDGNSSQVQEISFPPIGDQSRKKENQLFDLGKHLEEKNLDDQESWIQEELQLHLADCKNLAEVTKTLSWIPDLPALQEMQITNTTQNPNPNYQFPIEVASTSCKPFKENHQINLKYSFGNGIMDGDHQSNGQTEFEDDSCWNAMETTRIDGSGCSSSMAAAYMDNDLCRVVDESGFNDVFDYMQPSYFLPSDQFCIQDFDNGGMEYEDNRNVHSFDQLN